MFIAILAAFLTTQVVATTENPEAVAADRWRSTVLWSSIGVSAAAQLIIVARSAEGGWQLSKAANITDWELGDALDASAIVLGMSYAFAVPMVQAHLLAKVGVDDLDPVVPVVISVFTSGGAVLAAVGARSLIKSPADVAPAMGVAAIGVVVATATTALAGPLWWHSQGRLAFE